MALLLPATSTPRHHERQAIVCVRQSTPKQVREDIAGRENQYALVDRAAALGRARPLVRAIDDDLGEVFLLT